MRLHKIKLAGFKSFVDVTNIPFPDNMTAIVGPNGCGKSNVIDAVRWVLGESSAKNLRGDAMTDVIFNGSSARKPVSQCSVELVFDNTSGRIQGEFAKYNELSVKRVVNREAQSQYYLNGTKCRRRDITDIFLGTGLGPRSYAIIEQGMISRLIESKPQELRVFIEEAAGISKYKERRRETENRIRHTRENLERLQDVRTELAQQLDKLQRQAAAATRYKSLKSRERTLKGELATVRWLKHSDKVVAFEADIKQQEVAIEAFIAEQRGGEKNIESYHQQQQTLTAELQDLQQILFKVGSDISRLQQSQLHNKQRKNRIAQDLQQLQQNIDDTQQHQAEQQQKITELQSVFDEKQPELAIIEQTQIEAEERLFSAEERFELSQQSLREKEQTFHKLNQQIEGKKSQLQSLQQMAQRSQSRIAQIENELNNLDSQAASKALEEMKLSIADSEQQQQDLQALLSQHQQNASKCDAKVDSLNVVLAAVVTQQQQASGELRAIETLLQQGENPLQDKLDKTQQAYQSLWAYLNVPDKWQQGVESVLGYWANSVVLNDGDTQKEQWPGQSWSIYLMTEDKPAGSLASVVNNTKVPQPLTHVILSNSYEDALSKRSLLQPHESIVTPEGVWLGTSFVYCPQQDSQGQLQLLQRNDELQQLTAFLAEEYHQSETALVSAELESKQSKERVQTTQQQLTSVQAERQQLSLVHEHQNTVIQQTIERETALHDELNELQLQLEEEAIQSELVQDEIIELSESLAKHQQIQDDNDVIRQQGLDAIQVARQQYQNSKDQNHQIHLVLSTIETQINTIKSNQKREESQLERLRENQHLLLEEQEMLEQPDVEQGDELEQLLIQKLEIESQQVDLNTQLAEIETWLSDAEKGHRGVQQKVDAMRAELERNKLDCEGQRVRANSILEQLTEIGQSLKDVLETLPDDANESTWQSELEQVQRSVSRLGAVNLAAVEEFEQQSQRMSHLDSQLADLNQALDTLEGAIRKIDKETRTRFKTTFDQVNDDLKMLFPKVFGGGAAYLDLTDNDLLETGVTIMARPPGKKNSTIHLLSGGEKALTALSLVFAIFRLNPAPFCLLDEVDAPLDDANVGRFCKLVTEMSQTVQFIYISHNKIAMEMANHLTGVTMAEPGVSRMVSVTVDEAASMIEE